MEVGSVGSPVERPSDDSARSPVEGADWVPNPMSRSPSQASSVRSSLQPTRRQTGETGTVGVVDEKGLYSPPRSTASSPQVRRFQTPEGCDWRAPPECLALVSEDGSKLSPPKHRVHPASTPPAPNVPRAIIPVSPSRSTSVSVAVQTPAQIDISSPEWQIPEGSDWNPFQDQEIMAKLAKESKDIKDTKDDEEREKTVSASEDATTLCSEEAMSQLCSKAREAFMAAAESDQLEAAVAEAQPADAGEGYVTSLCLDAGAAPAAPAPEKAPEQAAELSEHEQLLAPSQTTAPECTPEEQAEDHGSIQLASPDVGTAARESGACEAVLLDENVGAGRAPQTPVRILTPAPSYSGDKPKVDLQVASTTDGGSREDSQHGLSPSSSRINSAASVPFCSPVSSAGPQKKQASKRLPKQEHMMKSPPNFMFHPTHRGSALGPPRTSHKSGHQHHHAGRTVAYARSPPPPALPFSQGIRAAPHFSPPGYRSPPSSSRGPFSRTGRSPEPVAILSRVATRSPPRALVSAPSAPPFCATSPRNAIISAVQRSPSLDGRGCLSRGSSLAPHSPATCHRRMLYPLSGQSAVVRQPSFAGHIVQSPGVATQDSLGRSRQIHHSPTRSFSAAPPLGSSFVAAPPSRAGSYVAPPMVGGSYVAPPSQAGSYVAPPSMIGSFVAPPPPSQWNQRYTPPDASMNASSPSLKRSYVPFPVCSHSPTRMILAASLSSRGAGATSRVASPPPHHLRRLAAERNRALGRASGDSSDA